MTYRLARRHRSRKIGQTVRWPAPGLERIQATLLAINSADDERNPPELGIMERELKRVKGGRLFLIPASEETRGHGTIGMAKFWKGQLQELLVVAPRVGK